MNASYKIVLLGAFILFLAVIGYYTFSGGDSPKKGSEALAQDTGDDAKPNAAGDKTNRNEPPKRNELDKDSDGGGSKQVVIAPPKKKLGFDPEPLPKKKIAVTEDEGRPAPPTDGDDTGDDPADPEGAGGDEPGNGEPEKIAGDPKKEQPDKKDPGTEGEGDPADPEPKKAEGEGEGEGDKEPDTSGDTETTADKKTYTIKAGDNFSKIAYEVYGDSKAWVAIAKANPTADPQRLKVGQVIVLPDLSKVVPDKEEETLPEPNGERQYTVRANDNLSKIAKKFYGNTEAWDLIYKRNRAKIGKNPHNLKVGMVLIIPQSFKND